MTVLPAARRDRIVAMLKRGRTVTVNGLAEVLDVSKETIRRDLAVLESRGRLNKVHGGAVPIRTAYEPSLDERSAHNREAKEQIAELAAALFLPGQSLLIDAGSTTACFAGALARVPGIHVVTNSLEVATAIGRGGVAADVILLTGRFRPDRLETVGALTVEQIGRFRADHAVLTVGAIDGKGLYDFDVEEAQVAVAMIESARQTTVLADSTKLQRQALTRVCDLSRVSRLVTERDPPPELTAALREQNVEVVASRP